MMNFFYERTESDDKVMIVLKPHSLYTMLLMVAVWLINELVLQVALITQIIMPVLLVFIAFRFISLLRVQKEVLLAMKQERVTTSGSKFSFSNPFTYIINK